MNHFEISVLESKAIVASPWEHWAARVEELLGHDLDGDQEIDGFSIDTALDMYEDGHSPEIVAEWFQAHSNYTKPSTGLK